MIELTKVIRSGFLSDRRTAGVVCEDSRGDEILLSFPRGVHSEFFAAFQSAFVQTSKEEGKKLDELIATALVAESIRLGPTKSGMVGLRMNLKNGFAFDLVMTPAAAGQLAEAASGLADFLGKGGASRTQ